MITLSWKSDLHFEAKDDDGLTFQLDSATDHGPAQGVSPLDALLAALGGCSGMDVVLILQKKRLHIASYRVEVDGIRKEGDYPHPYTSITLKHFVEGPDITEAAVEQAVRLSDEKYCSAIATLRLSPEIKSEFELVNS